LKILNVYKWATVGGVEKVILNRACAFKKHNADIKQAVLFFHDSGGLNNFKKFIDISRLRQYIEVVTELNERAYDYIITFDTPEVFNMVKKHSKIIVECHSPYRESRSYLKSLPHEIACLLSPSEAFIKTITKEIPNGFEKKLHILPNFHIFDKDLHKNENTQNKIWSKRPICYIGRMDATKNTKELLEIFLKLRKEVSDEFFLLLVGDVREHYMDLPETLIKTRLEDRTAYFRPIPYENVDVLLGKIREHKGIFVSPSKGESFGLSALEAMMSGLPVLLSDIDCHRQLVDGENAFLYEPGNIAQAVDKLSDITNNYDYLASKASSLSAGHSSESFFMAWERLMKKIHDN